MAEITEDMFQDDRHYRVYLKGRMNGEDRVIEYHLDADSGAAAIKFALIKWASEWDDVPFFDKVEKYRTWRLYEQAAQGRCRG